MKGSLLEPVTGRPVTGVIQAWRPDDLPSRDQPLATVQTDAGGQFELVLTRWFGEVVLRAHAPTGRDGIGRLRAVVQVPELPPTLAIWIDPKAEPLFLRGIPRDATAVWVDGGGRLDVRYGGWLTLPAVPDSRTRLWLDGGTMVADLDPEPRATEQQVTFVPAEACAVTGTVLGGGDARLRLELLDRAGRWPNPVTVTDLADPSGGFRLSFTRLLDPLPVPTFGVWAGDQRLAVIDRAADWTGTELTGVTIDLREVGTDAVYQLDGQTLRRDTRAPAGGLRIELWSGATLVKTADTDQAGRFTLTFVAPGTATAPPPMTLRIFQTGRRLPDVAVPPDAWVRRRATIFVEVDTTPVPSVRRVSGRVIDPSTRRPVPGLRVEMWDMAARSGGLTGVATFVAEDGTFDVALPVPDAATPRVFFRLYAGDVLVGTLDPPIRWDDTGGGSVLLEVAAGAATDGEVLLHELGETIAGAVDRMQQELSRYPSTLGAYVVDELDLSVPVAVQLDQLGQVRTKVVDRAPADEQLGQFRMRVRPVLGARAPLADRLDQPLSVLTELSAAAVERLNSLRIYSVEDLARLASAPAGRGALAGLGLDVDLDRLLDKAILLATTALPMPVREALLRLGVVSTAAFAAYPDPAALAEALSKDLGQMITTEAVQAWQQTVAASSRIVLPSV